MLQMQGNNQTSFRTMGRNPFEQWEALDHQVIFHFDGERTVLSYLLVPPLTAAGLLPPCLTLCSPFSCWTHVHTYLSPMQSSASPANSWRPEMLISVAGSWPIKVTCQERGEKAGDICWYFHLGWKQTNCTGVKCQRLLSVWNGREGGRSPLLLGTAFSMSLSGYVRRCNSVGSLPGRPSGLCWSMPSFIPDWDGRLSSPQGRTSIHHPSIHPENSEHLLHRKDSTIGAEGQPVMKQIPLVPTS